MFNQCPNLNTVQFHPDKDKREGKNCKITYTNKTSRKFASPDFYLIKTEEANIPLGIQIQPPKMQLSIQYSDE